MIIVLLRNCQLAALLLASLASAASAQEPYAKPQENAPHNEADLFFSGNVIEVAKDRLTVARTVLARPTEKRSFALNAETKIEGKIKLKTRVTVHYAPGEQGDIALTIIVRDKAEKDSKKQIKPLVR